MYYLTNGKEYVAENELIPGEYIKTTYTVKAKKFTYKEGMSFKKKRWKKDKDFKKYRLINVETGEMANPNYMGNGGAYIGDHNFDFDDGILDTIIHEADLIKSMVALDEKQLNEYKTILTNELSKKMDYMQVYIQKNKLTNSLNLPYFPNDLVNILRI